MNWDDLRIFIAAARAPTLAQAARALTIDATTVGRRLDRLARSLNTSLFESHAGGHVLTTHGEKLLAHAEAVETMLTDAADTLTGERSQLAGTVRVSLPEGFAAALVSRHLPQFAAQHPQIRIELVSTNGFLNPSKREADLAIMLARPARGPLVARKLSDYELGLYAAPTYLAAHGTPPSRAALRSHVLIGYIPDFIYAEELRYLDEVGDALEPMLSSSSINVQHSLIRAGNGIGVLPCFIGDQDSELTRVLAPMVRIERAFWMVAHRDLRRLARVDAFLRWLDQLMREQRTLLLPG